MAGDKMRYKLFVLSCLLCFAAGGCSLSEIQYITEPEEVIFSKWDVETDKITPDLAAEAYQPAAETEGNGTGFRILGIPYQVVEKEDTESSIVQGQEDTEDAGEAEETSEEQKDVLTDGKAAEASGAATASETEEQKAAEIDKEPAKAPETKEQETAAHEKEAKDSGAENQENADTAEDSAKALKAEKPEITAEVEVVDKKAPEAEEPEIAAEAADKKAPEAEEAEIAAEAADKKAPEAEKPADADAGKTAAEEQIERQPQTEDHPQTEEQPADQMAEVPAAAFINTLDEPQKGEHISEEGAVPVYYYRQSDARWSKLYYGGTDTIGKYACGPSSMSIVISSLSDLIIDPVQMAEWSRENGYWYPKSGSLHTLIPDAAEAFGLAAEGAENDADAPALIENALREGKLVVALMGKGHFTNGGHFIVLRGIDEEGRILVADPGSLDRTGKAWELSLIVKEARAWADGGGPFWIISEE